MNNHNELQERWKYFLDNFTAEDWKNFKHGELDHPESDEVTILGKTFKTTPGKPKKLEGLEVEYNMIDEVSYISPEVYEKLKFSNNILREILGNAVVTSVGGEGFIIPDKSENTDDVMKIDGVVQENNVPNQNGRIYLDKQRNKKSYEKIKVKYEQK